MTTIWSIRTLRLLALTAAAAAIVNGTAQARPDPGKGSEGSSAAATQVAAVNSERPTGPAEGTRLNGSAAVPGGTSVRLVEFRAAGDAWLDWRSVGLGALTAIAALGLAAGALGARRRSSRVRGAV